VSDTRNQEGKEALPDIVTHLLEECRMVLPGIQALFGFQLVAVFNQAFWERLSPVEQRIHLIAVALIVIAIALVMTPAAYHRQAEPGSVSKRFVAVSSRLLLWSMVPLLVAICLDFYLVARLIVHNVALSLVLALLLSILFVIPWFALPRFRTLQRWMSR
jgi:hypothetical protein